MPITVLLRYSWTHIRISTISSWGYDRSWCSAVRCGAREALPQKQSSRSSVLRGYCSAKVNGINKQAKCSPSILRRRPSMEKWPLTWPSQVPQCNKYLPLPLTSTVLGVEGRSQWYKRRLSKPACTLAVSARSISVISAPRNHNKLFQRVCGLQRWFYACSHLNED
jgi:hypothetical protein